MKFEQRVMKFRMWSKLETKMLYPHDIMNSKQFIAIGFHGLPVAMDNDSFKNDEIVGWNIDHNTIVTQWTGLTDKHGSDIYEGDVIKCEDNPEKCDYSLVGIVTMFNGDWCINQDLPFSMYREFSIEIVGNAFENPELLEVRR